MNKTEWKEKIVSACRDAGTYREWYENVIDTLSEILEQKDMAKEAFEKSGGQVVVRHTNKSGATNIVQNPALRVVNDLNRDALAYWRDLGLTPAGYKKLTANVVEDKTAQGFEKLLERIGT